MPCTIPCLSRQNNDRQQGKQATKQTTKGNDYAAIRMSDGLAQIVFLPRRTLYQTKKLMLHTVVLILHTHLESPQGKGQAKFAGGGNDHCVCVAIELTT